VPCSNATNIGERKIWTQSEFCTWQNSIRGQETPKMYVYCISPGDGQTSCKVLLTSSERRRCSNEAKTRNPLKFAEVPQTRQQISAASGLKFTILLGYPRRYCCLTSFVCDCRYVPYLRRYNSTKLCDGAQAAIFGEFLRPVFFSEPRAAHFRHAF